MKTSIRFSVVILILILLLVAGVSLTQAQQMGKTISPTNTISLGANLPWVSQYVHQVSYPLDVGRYTSLALRPYDDYPYISYYDQTNGDLMVASPYPGGGYNCGLNGNWWCQAIDGTNGDDVGQYSSIDVWGDSSANWKLGISYYDATHRALKTAIYSCYMGTCGWDIVTIGSPVFSNISIGLYTSFKFSSAGAPAIAYYMSDTLGSDAVYYAYPVASGGNCGEGPAIYLWQCDWVDVGDGVGQYASLDFSYDDQAFISYYDAGFGDLKYAYQVSSGNCGENNDWICTIINITGDVGLYTSLKAPQYLGDLLRIAYHDKTNGLLKYYDSSWGAVVVDDMGTSLSPMGISMDIDKDGYPIIAYQQIASEFSSPMLLVARPYLAFNDGSFGNCGAIPPGYQHLYWRCNILDPAAQYMSEADFVSVAVGSSGLAEIAYSEFYGYDAGDHAMSLKFIYQTLFHTFLPVTTRH